jgi:hypothetical protein
MRQVLHGALFLLGFCWNFVEILLDFFSDFIFPVLFQRISKSPLFNFPRFYIALFGIIRNRQCGGKEQSALQMERALLNMQKLNI